MVRLIGLLGTKGAGKDTAATFMVSEMGFVRTSFAAALYNQVAEAYGVSVSFLENRETKEKPLSELALLNCKNSEFTEIVLRHLVLQAEEFVAQELLLEPRSPRWTLQLWGTEYRRRSKYGYDSYWLDQVAALSAANSDTRYVITDVRFKNEADWVENQGGILIRVRRPVLEAKEAAARAAGTLTALHPSETELLDRKVNAELINREGEPDSLRSALYEVLRLHSQAA